VVKAVVKIDGSGEFENSLACAVFDVFFEGGGYGFAFGAVTAGAAGAFDQAVVEGEICSHGGISDR